MNDVSKYLTGEGLIGGHRIALLRKKQAQFSVNLLPPPVMAAPNKAESAARKLENALNRFGVRALEVGAWSSAFISIVCSSGMMATLISGLLNPACLPAVCLVALGATAALGLAALGAERWTWDRAMSREREEDDLARRSARYAKAPKAERFQPLGPKFSAVALTRQEAQPYLIHRATVLAADIKIHKPLQFKR